MMTSNALIGVLAAIGGKKLKKDERSRALVTALAIGETSAVSGFMIGQGAVDRNARDEAQDELQRERARADELDQQAATAFEVAEVYANMNETDRASVDKFFGDRLVALTEVFRPAPTPEEQRVLATKSTLVKKPVAA